MDSDQSPTQVGGSEDLDAPSIGTSYNKLLGPALGQELDKVRL
jgi:hypothetical protein